MQGVVYDPTAYVAWNDFYSIPAKATNVRRNQTQLQLAVSPALGLGMRFFPLNRTISYVLLPVSGLPFAVPVQFSAHLPPAV
jgi:hypothetical protein